jgi:DNA (cytosine-5)-methyltransferase 1
MIMKKFVDLFCGCGGFSRGFVEEDFEPVVAIEIDEKAASAYALNFNGKLYEKKLNELVEKEVLCYVGDIPLNIPPSDKDIKILKELGTYRGDINPVVINDDIREIHSYDILKICKKVDVVIGGPPCEAYTGANPNREKNPFDRLYKDEMGRLVLEYIRIVGDLQPEIFVMENVPGILEPDIRESIEKEFKKVGYDVYFNVLRAEDYGNPSSRRRVFVSNIEINPEKLEPVTVIGAIEDLMFKGREVPNHEYVTLPKRVSKRLLKAKWGEGLVKFKGSSGVLDNYIKLHPYKIAPTVMGKRRFIHPYENRSLTPREQARLMGYPDYHLFVGGKESQFNQVGESVPPTLSRAIAKVVKENL